jgi:V/A-type H+-transporting ATPase subunit B
VCSSDLGEEELTSLDHQYLEFGDFFEKKFVNQAFEEDRSIEQTLDLGWAALSHLPPEELQRLTDEEIEAHYDKG